MKKILFLTMNYPPMMTEGSSRAYKLAVSMPEIGWEPLVIAFAGLSGDRERGEPFSVRYPAGELPQEKLNREQLFRFVHGMPRKKSDFLKLRGAAPVRFDPGGEGWEKKARPEAEEVLRRNPDIELIYAQSPPLAPQRLALELSEKYKLPVIFDCIEPHDAGGLERSVMQSGHACILPSRELKEYFLRKYRGAAGHDDLTIVQNGYRTDGVYAAGERREAESAMRLVCRLDRLGGREARSFFAGISAFAESQPGLKGALSLALTGSGQDRAWRYLKKYDLTDLVESSRACSLAEELELCRRADLFCVVSGGDNGHDLFVPERLYDVLGMNIPLFGVLPDGPACRLIEEAGGLTAHPGDSGKVAELLQEALRRRQYGGWEAPPEEIVLRFSHGSSIQELLREMARILPLY